MKVVGLELYGRSDTYDWLSEDNKGFEKVTLFAEKYPRGLHLLKALWNFRRKRGHAVWFLCHYDWKEVFFFASILRLLGDQVFTMGCSKFDDKPRSAFKEWLKTWFLAPYLGAIGSGVRSRDYFRFLGLPAKRVVGEYNTVSLGRIRQLAGKPIAPDGCPFADRHFTIVARLVPKKNLVMVLDAYARYRKIDPHPRILHLCGSGPLEDELRAMAGRLGIVDAVIFHGFLQTAEISKRLASTLALVLPSIEEQFGNVVPEAQAMGLPVILSENCGARDVLVRSGVNGFVIEPDNPEGLAWFMREMAGNEQMWRRMCKAATGFAKRSDASAFASGALSLAKSKK